MTNGLKAIGYTSYGTPLSNCLLTAYWVRSRLSSLSPVLVGFGRANCVSDRPMAPENGWSTTKPALAMRFFGENCLMELNKCLIPISVKVAERILISFGGESTKDIDLRGVTRRSYTNVFRPNDGDFNTIAVVSCASA